MRLFRPFSVRDFIDAIPSTATAIAVLDRTKEPGASGEPLYQDVVTALRRGGRRRPHDDAADSRRPLRARVEGVHARDGQGGLRQPRRSRPETPLHRRHPRRRLAHEPGVRRRFRDGRRRRRRRIFYGLGADGTVGANKNSIKIIGEDTAGYAQGFFVYDSKKSGSRTISHLRFGPRPIRSAYLVQRAQFIACHQFQFLDRIDLLREATDGAVLLVNSPFGPEAVWDQLPRGVQEDLIRKQIRLFVIDGDRVAVEAGMAGRINTIMQTCFFAISGVLPRDEAIARIKEAVVATYGRKGTELVERNFAGIDRALENLHEIALPESDEHARACPLVPADAPAFVKNVTAVMIAGRGDDLRSARCRSTGPTHQGHHGGRNATFRTSSPSGGRTSAFSAATAPWCVRTR